MISVVCLLNYIWALFKLWYEAKLAFKMSTEIVEDIIVHLTTAKDVTHALSDSS